jgi:hypothetical protein
MRMFLEETSKSQPGYEVVQCQIWAQLIVALNAAPPLPRRKESWGERAVTSILCEHIIAWHLATRGPAAEEPRDVTLHLQGSHLWSAILSD